MSNNQLHNYLRRHRKKAALTQGDVAFLLGCTHIGKISRCERFAITPHLSTVIAYEVIFQAPAQELFSGLFEQTAREIKRRAQAMLNELNQRTPRPHTKAKIDHLRRIVKN